MAGYVYRGTEFDADKPLPLMRPEDIPEYKHEKCGTTAGYDQHVRYGTPRCRPCLDANNEYKRTFRRFGGKGRSRADFTPDRCGTLAGWNLHMRTKQPMCEPCRAAQAEYQIGYRARKRAA